MNQIHSVEYRRGSANCRSLLSTGRHLAQSGRTLVDEIRDWQARPDRDMRASVVEALSLVLNDLRDSYDSVKTRYRILSFGDLDRDIGGGFPPTPYPQLH